MASEYVDPINQEEEDGDLFIDSNDVLEEVPEDEDHPMGEDDDDVEGAGPEDVMDGNEVVWEDNSEQHFPNHGKSVFAVSAHPTEPLAVSGGEDDLGYIWDITDGEVVVKLTGHTDSVTSTAFSMDGEMIATGGMDGKVRVWRRVGKENWKIWEFLTELQGPDEVMVR
jgi:ribosome assembly protein SQT1